MQKISCEFSFEASHVLPRHPGKCRQLHGHSWRVRVELQGELNTATQFVMDFADVKMAVAPLIDMMDHQHLNYFMLYPSSENVAAWLGRNIDNYLCSVRRSYPVRVLVHVSETRSTWASWDSYDRAEPSWGSGLITAEEREELEKRAEGLWVKRAM